MKKFLSRLFSRFVMTALLVLLQLLVLFFGVYRLQYGYVFVSALLRLLSVIVVIYLISKDISPSTKLAWIVPILIFPVLGGLMYILYGHVVVPRKLKKNLLRVKEQMAFENLYEAFEMPLEEAKDNENYLLMNYTKKYAKVPLYSDTDITYYAMGEDMYQDLLEDLKSAEKYIFLEFFIINPGVMWDSILEILKEKVDDGVEVRVIYDDVGSTFYLSPKYYKELEAMGIKCIDFNRIFPFLATILNNRDHRKIVSIDGKIAYTGGVNLSDEYINVTHPLGIWKDSGVRIWGKGAWGFTVMFLQMWNVCRYTEPSYSIYKPEICAGKGSAGIVQPYGTVPLEAEAVGENIYIQMINNAKHYIYIFTPYMVVGNELLMAVKLAAKKGVDVRIVTPGVPDKKFIYRMTQSTYKELLQAGVRIFQYAPGFIHSKCVLCDDRVASVGSINMDNRSFYHHFECGILLYEVEQLKKIKGDMMETFEVSEEINLPWCREKLKGFGLFDALLRLLSPLL